MRKTALALGVLALVVSASRLQAKEPPPLVVSASNATANQLLVYDASGALVQTLSTQGQGGAGGNAGGVMAEGNIVAAVNFGSNSVAIFERKHDGLKFRRLVPAASPVSVAFGNDHLYVLGTTDVASYSMRGADVDRHPDGSAMLLHADGTAAQVGVLTGELIVTEKSNVIETIPLDSKGAVTGTASLVANIPGNVDTPFGLVTRGNNAYVTIAHADEISLVRNDTVLTTTASGTQHSPCWLTIADQVVGTFVYSSNSPSHSVSRYAVYGQHLVQDAAVAASFTGSPTDIDYSSGLLAVIDGGGGASRVSIFDVDQDGNLTLRGSASTTSLNGVAIVAQED